MYLCEEARIAQLIRQSRGFSTERSGWYANIKGIRCRPLDVGPNLSERLVMGVSWGERHLLSP